MALDIGMKTIGVAVSDELLLCANPICTIRRQGNKIDVSSVLKMVEEYEVTEIIAGLPLTLQGERGPRARRVGVFLEALKEVCNLPIHEWDERFSTKGANRVLLEADLSRKRCKEVIDKQAATYILQGWLDARGNR